MEFNFGILLLGLPLAFGLGWLASRLDLRQLRLESRQAPKAYFKGLNYLLNEQQDQAIDAFIEAVQNDPDTSELHFALGNLFRRRGEYERAVRVHQHLLSRGDLSLADHQRAQHALALDFLKAGLLDRAEEALHKLEGSPFEGQAWLALLAIYERSRDWAQASQIAAKLESSGQASFSGRQAHYLCEQATQASPEQALTLLRQACTVAPDAARPGLALAAHLQQQGEMRAAYLQLRELGQNCPTAWPLIAAPLANCAQACGEQAEALALLREADAGAPSLDVLAALIQLDPSPDATQHWYAHHLEREPSLVAATQWLAEQGLGQQPLGAQALKALEHASRPLTRYRCAACGFEARQHFWQCPGCQAWDSYPPRRIEEI